MRRTLLALALTGTLALAGCGLGTSGTATAAAQAGDEVADEAIALQQVGFDTGLADTASAGTGDAPRKAIRKYLRGNTLHGEVAIETRNNGTKIVVVQRGTVTAVDGDNVSVTSSDGFALTWTFDDKLRVVQNRRKVEASALTTGAEIGIAGTRDGDATSARLIAIR